MSETLHLGISTCPNDTFAFHAIIEREIDLRGLEFEIELTDVEELNRRLEAGEFDVAKASFHAALFLAEDLAVLPSGSALGFGVGPLLLAARGGERPGPGARVLCPGRRTTATLLYSLYHPGAGDVTQVGFDEIMPALESGRADFGVCIHEGRFTWSEHGLALVEDLGATWERATGAPLPLGGILARKRLGSARLRDVQAVVRDSIEWARTHRERTLPTMRRHAQELSDDVILAHVDLYVNEWTRDLGPEGRHALERLAREAERAGVLAPGAPVLEVVGP